MRDSESTFARGGELLAGLLVVAFIVFLLWVVLLRPRDDESTDVSATPTPATAITPTPDDPNMAFDQVIATPTPEPTPTATPIPRPTPTPTATVYVVQPGDTLSGIAGRFNVAVDDLVEANRIVNPDALQVGQEITIP
ncbi:MAG: LysM domain-containing protein [Chloroflexota bacterium]|nr:LysM domain-containing protein [Chloroflexota bacterium]MDE2898592.1 LysM domain-containing protein [Chloroflexota bacterium]